MEALFSGLLPEDASPKYGFLHKSAWKTRFLNKFDVFESHSYYAPFT